MSRNDNHEIMRREEVTRSMLLRTRPTPDGNTAILYVDRRGRLYSVDRALTPAEIYLDTPKIIYTVDTAVHPATLELDLPAEEEAFSFHARVSLAWQVGNPQDAVENSLSDAEQILRPYLEEKLRGISRRFPIEQNAAAEKEINRHYGDRIVNLPHGLQLLRCTVALSLDGSTRQHIAQRTYDSRRTERREREHDTKLLHAKLAEKEAEAQHNLDLQKAKFEQTLAAQEAEHLLAMERQRMEFYAAALQSNELNLIALRLSSNRDDVNDVINLVMRQRQLDFDSAHGMLTALLENRLANRSDVADIMARASKVVADHLGRSPFGVTVGRPGVADVAADLDAASSPARLSTGAEDQRAVLDAEVVRNAGSRGVNYEEEDEEKDG